MNTVSIFLQRPKLHRSFTDDSLSQEWNVSTPPGNIFRIFESGYNDVLLRQRINMSLITQAPADVVVYWTSYANTRGWYGTRYMVVVFVTTVVNLQVCVVLVFRIRKFCDP